MNIIPEEVSASPFSPKVHAIEVGLHLVQVFFHDSGFRAYLRFVSSYAGLTLGLDRAV